jgi:hypothetical protein
MFAVLHSDINTLESGLLHLSGKPYCKKSRSAKVKDGIINLILRNYLMHQYTQHNIKKLTLSITLISAVIKPIMQNVIMLDVTVLNVVAPDWHGE